MTDGTRLEGQVLSQTPEQVAIAVIRRGERMVVEVPRAEVRRVRLLDDREERLLSEAEAALLEARHERAVQLLQELAAARPLDGAAQRELGFALLLAGREEAGMAALGRACELDPLDLEAHLQLGQTLARLERRDPAILRFRQATRLGPRHVAAWRSLARLLLARGTAEDRREAKDALRRASLEAPEDEDLALERTLVLLEDEPEEALRALRAFAGRAPRAARAGRLLAQLEASAGDLPAAVQRVGGLLARLPAGDARLREALEAELALYRWLAAEPGSGGGLPEGTDAGSREQDPAQAERRLRILLGVLPDDGRLQLALARALFRQGQLSEARVWLERAAHSGPDAVAADALLLQEVAAVLFRAQLVPGASEPARFLGRTVALPKARRLARLAPWLVASHRTLAETLAREGRFDDAAAAREASLPWAPDAATRARLAKEIEAARALAEQQRRNKNL